MIILQLEIQKKIEKEWYFLKRCGFLPEIVDKYFGIFALLDTLWGAIVF